MKNSILKSVAFIAISTFLFTGCAKDENATPEVTLIGDKSDTISLNSSYSDPGATAQDEEDGILIVTSDYSSTNPDVNTTGSYKITYSATDADGNTGTAVRTVIVRNDAYMLADDFTTTETPSSGSPWTQTITVSTTENNVVTFGKFANYQNNSSIKGKIFTVGSDKYVKLNPSPQSANGIGSDGCNHDFADDGNGAKLTQTSGKWTFSVKFTDETTGGGAGCTATGALQYEDTFIQN